MFMFQCSVTGSHFKHKATVFVFVFRLTLLSTLLSQLILTHTVNQNVRWLLPASNATSVERAEIKSLSTVQTMQRCSVFSWKLGGAIEQFV